MCRIAAYVGPPTPLAGLVYEPEHSLAVQAYRPREMISGTINVDGTGVAWWPDGDPDPLRFVTELPPWSDANLPDLSRRLHGHTILATVRSATPGIPSGPGSVLPFVEAGIAGSHNGYLAGFQDGVAARLLAHLPADLVSRIDTLTDSKLLFLLAIAALRDGDDLGRAAERAVDQAARACDEDGFPASLNLVLAQPGTIIAVRCARGVPPNSLYTRCEPGDDGRGWLASEPLDEGSWAPVAADQVVCVTATGVTERPVTVYGAP